MRTDVHDRRTYNNRSDSRRSCAMPPPHPKHRQPTQSRRTRHRATERGRTGRHPRTEGEPPRATGVAGAGTGSEAEPESVGGNAGRNRTGGATVGQAKTGRATRRPSEPRRADQDAAEGTATTADADGAQRATERRTAPIRYHINMYAPPQAERQGVENRAFTARRKKFEENQKKGLTD